MKLPFLILIFSLFSTTVSASTNLVEIFKVISEHGTYAGIRQNPQWAGDNSDHLLEEVIAVFSPEGIKLTTATIDGPEVAVYAYPDLEVVTRTEPVPGVGTFEVQGIKPKGQDFPVFLFRSDQLLKELNAFGQGYFPPAHKLVIEVTDQVAGTELTLYSPSQIKAGDCEKLLQRVEQDGHSIRR